MVLNNHSDSTHERIPGAEPAPAWPEAKEKYQWAWELHYIGLACACIMIALYSLIVVLVLLSKGRNRGGRKSALYLNSVHGLLVMFGITRAAFLLMDPYELELDYPLVSTRLLFGLGFPCLTSSYSLLHVGFLEISQIKLSGNKLGNKKFVFGVITSHFVVVIIADTTTALKRETALLLLVCMSFFIVWGFAISVSVLYSGIKVIRKVNKQTNIIRSYSRCRNSGKQSDGQIFAGTSLPNRGKKTIRITLCTAVLALGLCLCNLIALLGVYNVYRGVRKTAQPWQWWSFQTIFRLIEIALAVVMGYAVTPVDLWGKHRMRRNTCTSMIVNNPRSRLNTESVVVFNNFVASSRPRGLSERTGSEPRDLQVSPNLANTEVRGERKISDVNVMNEEKLSSVGMEEAFLCQPEPLQRFPPKTPTLLTLRL